VKRHHAAAAAVTALALGSPCSRARRACRRSWERPSPPDRARLARRLRPLRPPRRPALQATLAVFAVVFLLRLFLVGAGVAVVARAGASAIAFVVAFFVPYFAFVAIEGSYVHALGRRMRKTA